MVRLALFFTTAAAVLGVLMWLNWWVDPLGDVYDKSATARILEPGKPCLVSDDVVGVNSWWDFKRDLFRRRRPRVAVVGTSRVLQIRSRPGEQGFVNVGLPGTAPVMLSAYFRDLHAAYPGRITLYLGVEIFWLNANWTPPYYYSGPGRKVALRDLINRQRLGQTLSRIAEQPSVLFHRWTVTHVRGQCVLDVAGRAGAAKVAAWWPDGSFSYPWELRPDLPQPPPANDFERDLGNLGGQQYLGAYYANWNELSHVRDLEQSLALARRFGWLVVGFVPPYSTRYVKRLSTAQETASRWREVGRFLPRLFHRFGFAYADTRWVRTIPCPEDAFSDDGWHANAECSARERRILDAAALRMKRG